MASATAVRRRHDRTILAGLIGDRRVFTAVRATRGWRVPFLARGERASFTCLASPCPSIPVPTLAL